MSKNKRTSHIITVIIRRVIAVLKANKKINDYTNNAKVVYQSMSGNAYFPASALSITMVQFDADVKALDDAQTDFSSTPPTATKAQRDAAKRVVEADLRLLLNDVQKVADNNPEKAEDIITGAGFAVKRSSAHDKFVGARNTNVSGTIKLFAPEARHHEWAQLADDGVTWNYLRATSSGKKIVSGLTKGKSYIFKSAPILNDADGEGEWTIFAAILVT